jgi:hypothetical protein
VIGYLSPSDLPPSVQADALSLLLGPLLGQGQRGYVYEHGHNPEWVVKVETTCRSFQNAIEWEIWSEAKDTKWRRWFAPCLFISPCGMVLVQQRVEPLDERRTHKVTLPSFFNDLKPDNFGWAGAGKGRRLVAMDYGYRPLLSGGLKGARLVKRSLEFIPNEQAGAWGAG